MSAAQIILGSSSPYRRLQLEQLGLRLIVDVPRLDEEAFKGRDLGPRDLARQLSEAKAQEVALRNPDALVIAGDQVAAVDETILNKPGTRDRAVEQLGLLSGRWHDLFSAVTVIHQQKILTHVDHTRLKMRHLSEADIYRYLEWDQSWDCAAAYKFERAGALLIEEVESKDPTAITGVPLMGLATLFLQLTGSLPLQFSHT